MESLDHVLGLSTDPTTSGALPGASTARFHDPNTNSLHGETELTATPTLDEEQIGGDLTALLNRSDDSSSAHQPRLPRAPLLNGTSRLGEVPARDAHERRADHGNARLQLKGPKWLFNGQGWDGAFPLKWCVAAASFGLAMDQNLMAPNLSAIAADFGMDPTERDRKLGGQVAFAFFLVGAPAALGIGFAADRVASRRDLLAATTFVGAVATAGSGLAPNFTCLFWTRALAGGAVGGMMPLCLSLLADLYSPKERTVATGLLAMASGVGTGTGQNLGGILGPWFGWRCPFVVSSLPATAVALVIFWFTADPPRGAMDLEDDDEGALGGETEDEGHRNPAVNSTRPSSSSAAAATSGGGSSGDFNDGSSGDNWTKNGPALTVQSPMHTVEHSSLSTFADDRDDDHTTGSFMKDDKDEEDREEIEHHYEEKDAFDDETEEEAEVEIKDMSSDSTPPNVVADLRVLCSTPSVLLAYAQGGPGCVPWGIVGVFLNDYLAQDKGLGVTASTGVQTALGLGGLLGTWLGGYWGQRAYNYRGTRSFMPLFMGTAAALGAFPFWLLLNLPSGELGEVPSGDKNSSASSGSISGGGALGGGASWSLLMVYVLAAFVTGIIICMTGNCVRSMVQNTTLPHTRGAAFALFNLSDDLGRGLGPLAVAALVESFGGRQQAFNVATAGWLVCGLLNMAAAFTIDRDADAVVLWVNHHQH